MPNQRPTKHTGHGPSGRSGARSSAADASMAARLDEAERRYRALVEDLDAIVYVRNLQTGETHCSPQARSILGYEPDVLAAPGFWRTLVVAQDRDRIYAAWDADVDWGAALQYRMRHADGRIVWVDERWKAVAGADGTPGEAYAVVTDITGRRQLEEAVSRVERLEAVARVASAVGHDFGNVLFTISLYQGFIAEALGPDHPQAGDTAAIADAVDRGRTLISQLLAVGRESPEESVGALDVLDVLDNLEPVLRAIASPATLRIEAEGGDMWPVRIGRRALEHAILNLVINARDAMTGRAGTIDATLTFTSVPPNSSLELPAGRYVSLTVADSGPGMTREVRDHAFEPFYTTKERGTGLGLPSVLRTVRGAGGAVKILSAPGAGTTVTLLLPEAAEIP